jgi:hypothetical protein
MSDKARLDRTRAAEQESKFVPYGPSVNRQEVRTVILLQTHYVDRALLKRFDKLTKSVPQHEARILMHVPPGTPKPPELAAVPHHFVTTPEICNRDYINKIGGADWRLWRGGNTDLIGLHFFLANPDYDRYWFLEYDLRFSGSWATLFDHFEQSDADLLAASVRRGTTQPDWYYWPSLQVPDGMERPPLEEMFACFMPLARISKRGFKTIDQAYRAGWSGHCEVTWPTILNRFGLTIEDIGGHGEFARPENRNRFYTNNPLSVDLNPGSLVFRPVRFCCGLRRNTLWHPVKPPYHALREDMRLLYYYLKPYLPGGLRRPVNWIPEAARRGPSGR